jgi:hypothetical protein
MRADHRASARAGSGGEQGRRGRQQGACQGGCAAGLRPAGQRACGRAANVVLGPVKVTARNLRTRACVCMARARGRMYYKRHCRRLGQSWPRRAATLHCHRAPVRSAVRVNQPWWLSAAGGRPHPRVFRVCIGRSRQRREAVEATCRRHVGSLRAQPEVRLPNTGPHRAISAHGALRCAHSKQSHVVIAKRLRSGVGVNCVLVDHRQSAGCAKGLAQSVQCR